ncbi:MAG: cytochrome c maturation protein CcmE [Acidimicrobiales bacterium]
MTELDLTPQPSQAPKGRSWRNWLIMGFFALAAGAVLFQALSSARVFFLNVDEAIERRSTLGDDTFRMQGTVVTEPETADGGSLVFTISFGGEDAEVRHVGDEPSNLFKFGEKIIAEGHWEGDQFESKQIVVKHSEEYVEENPNRVDYELEETVPEVG